MRNGRKCVGEKRHATTSTSAEIQVAYKDMKRRRVANTAMKRGAASASASAATVHPCAVAVAQVGNIEVHPPKQPADEKSLAGFAVALRPSDMCRKSNRYNTVSDFRENASSNSG